MGGGFRLSLLNRTVGFIGRITTRITFMKTDVPLEIEMSQRLLAPKKAVGEPQLGMILLRCPLCAHLTGAKCPRCPLGARNGHV